MPGAMAQEGAARHAVPDKSPGETLPRGRRLRRSADFQAVLREAGYFCMVRRPRGEAVAAACGQLATPVARLSR